MGPYAVVSYTSGIAVAAGSHFMQPTIWYPTGGTGPFPGVVYIPGLSGDYLNPPAPVSESDSRQWAQFLASHGFVVMFVNSTNTGASPPEKATALLEAVEALVVENGRAGSPANGLLQTQNIAVMGHSFGGAGALFAANGNSNPRVKAAFGLSPIPNNSVNGPYPNDVVPTLILGGQNDPFGGDFVGEYNTIPASTSKMVAVFPQNGEKVNMHNVARTPLGSASTDPIVARYGLSFLEVYMVGDTRYQQFLVSDPVLISFFYHP